MPIAMNWQMFGSKQIIQVSNNRIPEPFFDVIVISLNMIAISMTDNIVFPGDTVAIANNNSSTVTGNNERDD